MGELNAAWRHPMAAVTCPRCAWWKFDTQPDSQRAGTGTPLKCPECTIHHPRQAAPRLVPVWLTATARDVNGGAA